MDVSKLDELRKVLRDEGVIPSDGAECLVPPGAGVGGELVETLAWCEKREGRGVTTRGPLLIDPGGPTPNPADTTPS